MSDYFTRPASEPPVPCTGSGLDMAFTDEDVTFRSKGKPRYARATCPVCGRSFVVKVAHTRNRAPIVPVAVVPRHRTAQEG